MSIEQFELILYDMYQMDAWTPPLAYKWKESFQEASWSKWALNELKEYVAGKLYPHTSGTIQDFYTITREFMLKMARYSKTNRRTNAIFQTGRKMAADVLDLLRAML